MATGSIMEIMGMDGFHTSKIFGLIILMATGLIPIMVGRGFQIIIGVGHLFITEDGYTISVMVGYGSQDINGLPHGLRGEVEVITMVGLHLAREWISI